MIEPGFWPVVDLGQFCAPLYHPIVFVPGK
jgi:hypothetical protein